MSGTKRNFAVLFTAVMLFVLAIVVLNLESIGVFLNNLVESASAPEISLSNSKMKVKIGEDAVLKAQLKSKSVSGQEVLWSSGNELVAKVNPAGEIEGMSVGDTYIVATTTDGKHKASCSIHVYDEKLDFSKNSGFYDQEFDLKLSAPEGEIYYTLDGTIPDKNSSKYVKPIKITDASSNKNVWSMCKDVSAGFLKEEILSEGGEVPVYECPDYNIDKCTIVRAVVYVGDEQYSDIKTMSYFVGYQNKAGYKNVNVLSM